MIGVDEVVAEGAPLGACDGRQVAPCRGEDCTILFDGDEGVLFHVGPVGVPPLQDLRFDFAVAAVGVEQAS